ncbi:phytoene dehydrogenase [Corallococcus exercitus]|uniref:FAD-dependent oxidoreductase n=1 Tax=Corallococcus exercitus TaxID=2316736 RepID=UPI000EA3B360|nr:FAD-dependent oxidoreductase [Corallococcus exercitus]RKG77974.1 phytoene dehydrogenase [Corallococcus exercitus]
MADTVPPSPAVSESKKPLVHVFGAGIAGLTAAHELALRGFKVRVFERDRALDARGTQSLAIGGLARTQYFQPSKPGSITFQSKKPETSEAAGPNIRNHPDTSTSVSLGLDQARPFPSLWLEFQDRPAKNYKPQLTQRSRNDLQSALKKLTRESVQKLGQFRIHIQPFYDQSLRKIEEVSVAGAPADSGDPHDDRARATKRAEVVAKKVLKQLNWDHILGHPVVRCEEPLPANTELGQPPTARNWVRVVLERVILPGEHGYRYFPSYYSHVFDTMRRIPIYDNNALPTARTTYDNLVALPTIGIASEKAPPFVTTWGPYSFPNSISRELVDLLNLSGLGITSKDIFQFSLRVLRYMLTSPERRKEEFENVSWWDYIQGHDPKACRPLYCYSKAFADLIQSSGRVLVALDGMWADARTTGNTYVQLLTDVLVPTANTHATLNGPTSAAWFSHWHMHLRRLGVQFIHGELTGFEQADPSTGRPPRYKPTVQIHSGEPPPEGGPDDYYVVAVDVLAAEQVTKKLPPLGVPAKLRGYTTLVPAKAGEPGTIQREPTQKPGMFSWDRLQTLSGIQYFYTTEFNLINGYLYTSDAPWRLSAICSPVAWQHQPIQEKSQYQSMLSVDIGEWMKGSPATGGKTAWESTPAELEQETSRQLIKALEQKKPGLASPDFIPPKPAYIHIDEGLVYDGSNPKQARLVRNKTPFLLPIVSDWKYRPGPDPWDLTKDVQPDPISDGVWQATHGGYYVHWDQLVFAGTYNKTFTRLTTMESANESARHAVNAILDHCNMKKRRHSASPVDLQVQEQFFATTPLGDYCRIWDPEANELPDVMLLREWDAINCNHGLPHPWDLLGVEVLPSMLSHLSAASPASATSTDAFAQVESLLRGLGTQSGHGGGEGLVGLLRRIRTHLEESLRRGAAGYRPPTS